MFSQHCSCGVSLLFGVHHQPWRDVHRHEFLEQQFRCVGQFHLRDLRLVLAPLALVSVVAQVGYGDQAAEVAHVDTVRVANLEQERNVGIFLEKYSPKKIL